MGVRQAQPTPSLQTSGGDRHSCTDGGPNYQLVSAVRKRYRDVGQYVTDVHNLVWRVKVSLRNLHLR